MTHVAILPVPGTRGRVSYRAIAGEKHAQGRTAGQALDGLASQLSADEGGTLVIVQNLAPDEFFTAAQQQRLAHLMALWQGARDRHEALPAAERRELEALVEAELHASAARSRAMAD